jgi:ribonuclease HII
VKTSLPRPTLAHERELAALGYRAVAGVDEAGRGPLAGPVVAAAVLLPPGSELPALAQLHDSKQLSPDVRERLYEIITREYSFGLGLVDAATIDAINIRQASWQAMQQAVADLQPRGGVLPDYVLIDGLPYGAGPWPYEAIVQGDAKSLSIAAASVVAKVTRDRLMQNYDAEYSGYGFARHKGYGTAAHLKALQELGPCVIHRRSFAPVRRAALERVSLQRASVSAPQQSR